MTEQKLFLGRAQDSATTDQLNIGDTVDAKHTFVTVDAKPTGHWNGHCRMLTAQAGRVKFTGRDFIESDASRAGNGTHTYKINRGEYMALESRDTSGAVRKWYMHLSKSGKLIELTYAEVKNQLLEW
jgi:hypothetical protein